MMVAAGPDDTYEGYDDEEEEEEYYDNEEGDPTSGLDAKHEEMGHLHNGHYLAMNNPEEEEKTTSKVAAVSEF